MSLLVFLFWHVHLCHMEYELKKGLHLGMYTK
jgi:hypothetical protein